MQMSAADITNFTFLNRVEKEKLDDAKAEAERMKAQLAKEKQLSENRLEEQKKQILKAIHTIHLYASISEEEAKSQQMKENQRTIIEICEEMLAKNE